MARVKRAVLFQFKEDTPAETIEQFLGELGGLRQSAPGVEDFHAGPYNGSDGLNKAYTHGFVMTFADEAARDGFGPHPEHQRVVGTYGGHIADVVAFDFLA